jgi:aryl sulfotransferase
MTILQAGMAKSGNFWLYRILQNIIHHGGLPAGSFIQQQPVYAVAQTWKLSTEEQADVDVMDIEPHGCFYRISSIFRMPIEDLDAYIAQCSHVWTHSAFCAMSNTVLPKFAKVVYVIRDPRDVAISMSRFAFTDYMQKYNPPGETDRDAFLDRTLALRMKNWAEHVGGYLKAAQRLNIHILFYERLLLDFDAELARLLDYLGVALDADALVAIKRDVDFKTMQSANPQHVRKGQAGQWMETLSGAQQRRARRVAAPMLRMLGYPLVAGDAAAETLPALPAALDTGAVDRAVRHARLAWAVREVPRRALAYVRGGR